MNKQWFWATSLAILLSGCVTDPYTGERRISKAGKGAGIGAVVGAGTGALFGGNRGANAGWGALAGGAVGAAIGAYMDHQERAMRQSLQGTGIEVQRTAQNTLNLTMPSNITFAFDSAALTPQVQSALDSVASVLNQYPDTTISVTGHTDDIGKESYNQTLSERRAASVAGYLINHNVNGSRMTQRGMGQVMPKVPNTSEENRAQNRRVELAVVANSNAAPTTPSGSPPPQGTYPPAGGSSYPSTNSPAGGAYGYPR
jgi:outer membrane protein OmpA-like peptidoglycan-associated protein